MGEGIIHSTDEVIEAQGDYITFFNEMIENRDFLPLARAHSTNTKNIIKSMEDGITPVILDNTNIKLNEAKFVVQAALKLGLSDDNIKIVDVGAAGLTAKQLSERNTHGVPLEKIESMMASHKGQGDYTLKRILESKDMYKENNILYSAVVLDSGSREVLLDRISHLIPKDWVVIAHHMTIVFGKGVPNKTDIGKVVTLNVGGVGRTEMALAVLVSGYETTNENPHITIAINHNGGKPSDSKDIVKWEDIKPFNVMGTVTEIKKR